MEIDTTKISVPRCSKADRIVACPASLIIPKHFVDSKTPISIMGDASHELNQSLALATEPDIDGVAKKYDVNMDELTMLFAMSRKIWADISKYFDSAMVEQHFDTEYLTGTCDIISLNPMTTGAGIAINDWKTGHGTTEHDWQLRGYAHCAAVIYGLKSGECVLAIESWVRHGNYRIHKFDSADLARFQETLFESIESAQSEHPRYNPSSQCAFCPRLLECGAYADYTRSSCNALVEIGKQEITVDLLASMYDRVAQLKRAIENYDTLIKAQIEKGGPIALDDTRNLEYVEQSRDEINVEKSYAALTEMGISDKEFIECVSVTKTALKELIGSKSSKGQKGKDINNFFNSLEQAGGVQKSYFKKLQVVKK